MINMQSHVPTTYFKYFPENVNLSEFWNAGNR